MLGHWEGAELGNNFFAPFDPSIFTLRKSYIIKKTDSVSLSLSVQKLDRL